MAKAISAAWSQSKRKNIIRKHSGYPVWQYTLDGKFVQEWPSINHAIRVTRSKRISECLSGKVKTTRNSFWKYAKGSRPKKLNLA